MTNPLPLYDVTVSGFPTYTYSARSRGHALSQAFRDYGIYDEVIRFKDFLKIATAVRRQRIPALDGYEYVRERYDIDIRIGKRVILKGGPSRYEGNAGTVSYPGPRTTSVHVLIDQTQELIVTHPLTVLLDEKKELAA